MEQASGNKRHPFSYTLGPGPYRFVGFFELVLPSEANQGRHNYHMAPPTENGCGSCRHCGRGIIYNYIVQTGEGKRFAVGCECIQKVGGNGEFSNLSTFEKHQRELKRKAGQERRKRQQEKLATECKALVGVHLEKLATAEHPFKAGLTFKEYAAGYITRHHTLNGWKIFKAQLAKILEAELEAALMKADLELIQKNIAELDVEIATFPKMKSEVPK